MTQTRSGGGHLSAGSKGVFASVGSSTLFGIVYLLTPLMEPLPAESLWAVRAALTLPFVTLVLVVMRQWHTVTEIGSRIRRRPLLLVGIIASGALLSVQLWLFGWAPLNGRGLQVALGYFLLPLVLVVIGRMLYADRMRWWQWCAAGIAAVGVGYEIIRVGGIGWETLVVALGYPVYFVLRRWLGTSHIGGMWWELAVVFPLAVGVMITEIVYGTALIVNPSLWWAAPGISLLAACALLCYLLAARLLTMSLFGLLSYAEPALLVVAALLIGERIMPDELFTYGAIWLAVLVLIVGGASRLRGTTR